MAQEKVRMTHPKLPGREIWIRPAGVKARERAGWKVTPQEKSAATSAATRKGDA